MLIQGIGIRIIGRFSCALDDVANFRSVGALCCRKRQNALDVMAGVDVRIDGCGLTIELKRAEELHEFDIAPHFTKGSSLGKLSITGAREILNESRQVGMILPSALDGSANSLPNPYSVPRLPCEVVTRFTSCRRIYPLLAVRRATPWGDALARLRPRGDPSTMILRSRSS